MSSTAHRVGIAETLVATAVVLGVMTVGLALVGLDFDSGHVALTGLAAAVAAAGTAVAALRRSTALAAAALIASFAVVAKALAFDAFELEPDSLGGWSLLLAAGGLLAAGVALHVLWRTAPKLVVVSGSAATVALGVALIGVGGGRPDRPDRRRRLRAGRGTASASPSSRPSTSVLRPQRFVSASCATSQRACGSSVSRPSSSPSLP